MRVVAIAMLAGLAQAQSTPGVSGTLYTDPFDPRIAQFVDDRGTQFEIQGEKDVHGNARRVRTIQANVAGSPNNTLLLGDDGRPSLLVVDRAGFARYIWRSPTTATIQVCGEDGALAAQFDYDFVARQATVRSNNEQGVDRSAPEMVPPLPPPTPTPTPGTTIPSDPPTPEETPAYREIRVGLRDAIGGVRDDALTVDVVINWAGIPRSFAASRVGPGEYLLRMPVVDRFDLTSIDEACGHFHEAVGLLAAAGGPFGAVVGVSIYVVKEGLDELLFGGKAGNVEVLLPVLEAIRGHGPNPLGVIDGLNAIKINGHSFWDQACVDSFRAQNPAYDFAKTPFSVHAEATFRDCDVEHTDSSGVVPALPMENDPIALTVITQNSQPAIFTAIMTLPDGVSLVGDQRSPNMLAGTGALLQEPSIDDGVASGTQGSHSFAMETDVTEVPMLPPPAKRFTTKWDGSGSASVDARSGQLVCRIAGTRSSEQLRAPKASESDSIAAAEKAYKEAPRARDVGLIATQTIRLQPGQTARVQLRFAGALATGKGSGVKATLNYIGGFDFGKREISASAAGSGEVDRMESEPLIISYETAAAQMRLMGGFGAQILEGAAQQAGQQLMPQIEALRKQLEQRIPSPSTPLGDPNDTDNEQDVAPPLPDAPHCIEIGLVVNVNAHAVVSETPANLFAVAQWQVDIQE